MEIDMVRAKKQKIEDDIKKSEQDKKHKIKSSTELKNTKRQK